MNESSAVIGTSFNWHGLDVCHGRSRPISAQAFADTTKEGAQLPFCTQTAPCHSEYLDLKNKTSNLPTYFGILRDMPSHQTGQQDKALCSSLPSPPLTLQFSPPTCSLHDTDYATHATRYLVDASFSCLRPSGVQGCTIFNDNQLCPKQSVPRWAVCSGPPLGSTLR